MVKFIKKMDVKSPSRGTSVAAGIDFYIPYNTEEFQKAFIEKNSDIEIDASGIILMPHTRVNIPSGIKVEIPHNHALIAYNKSGVSLKYGLDVGASVVDENKCIGCGVCTTKCEFDAIKLHREHPECSTMVNSDDKMKAILPYMIKRKIAIKKAKKG